MNGHYGFNRPRADRLDAKDTHLVDGILMRSVEEIIRSQRTKAHNVKNAEMIRYDTSRLPGRAVKSIILMFSWAYPGYACLWKAIFSNA